MIRYFTLFVLSISFVYGRTNQVKKLVFPTEVKDISKKAGAIYYSPGKNTSALIPTNIWGEVKNSGLHYIPQKTSLLNGLSLAGGTTDSADLEEVTVSRRSKGKWNNFSFDLTKASNDALDFELHSGDVIRVKKDYYYENRTYYTTVISVIATVISTALLYEQVQKI